MIVSPNSYYGLPPSQVAALNAVAEATLSEFYRLASTIYEKLEGKERDFGDIDYTLIPGTCEAEGTTFKRMLITDHSAGWKGVIQWGNPFVSMPQYAGAVDLWIAAREEGSLDWSKLDEEWGSGRKGEPDLYIKARRLQGDEPFGQPIHTLDFKHPFLLMLKYALDELDGDL